MAATLNEGADMRYRITDGHKGFLTTKSNVEIADLMFDDALWGCMHRSWRTLNLTTCCFRLLSRGGACNAFFIDDEQEKLPVRGFSSVDPALRHRHAEECRDINAIPLCQRDPFFLRHLERHHNRVEAAEIITTLRTIAILSQKAIGPLECTWAWLRRWTESEQTHRASFKRLRSLFLNHLRRKVRAQFCSCDGLQSKARESTTASTSQP